MLGLVIVLLIMFGMEETMYDRKGRRKIIGPEGFKARCASLVGIPGWKTSMQAPKWKELIMRQLRIIWRPHFVGVNIYQAMTFGFSVGLLTTATIFFQTPPPFGFGFSPLRVAGLYSVPIISVLTGELLGRYLNDWIMYYCVRRNTGVFVAESRLWTCYLSTSLFLIGFLLVGAAFQHHFHLAVVIIGWIIVNISYLMTSVAVYAYCNDCFPGYQGEVSTILNLARMIGAFSVLWYQVPWSSKDGAFQTFGTEAGIVCGLFLLIVPILQYKGSAIREQFSM